MDWIKTLNSLDINYIYFLEALKKTYNDVPHGKKSDFSKSISLNGGTISQVIKGKRVLSSQKCINLAKKLGYEYEAFLALGRKTKNSNDEYFPEDMNELESYFFNALSYHFDNVPIGKKKEFANKIGITFNNISHVIKARRNISITKKQQIAKYLGYEYNDFLDFGRNLKKDDEEELVAEFIASYQKDDEEIKKVGSEIDDHLKNIYELQLDSKDKMIEKLESIIQYQEHILKRQEKIIIRQDAIINNGKTSYKDSDKWLNE